MACWEVKKKKKKEQKAAGDKGAVEPKGWGYEEAEEQNRSAQGKSLLMYFKEELW